MKFPPKLIILVKQKSKEFVLIHRSAREDDFDPEGKLNFDNNPIFRTSQFSQAEINEISESLNISSGDYYLKGKESYDFFDRKQMAESFYKESIKSTSSEESLSTKWSSYGAGGDGSELKIKGKEVTKTSGYWKVSWWGREGNEIYCKKCAIKQDRRDQVVLIVFYLLPLTFLLAYGIYLLLIDSPPVGKITILVSVIATGTWLICLFNEFFTTRKGPKKKK